MPHGAWRAIYKLDQCWVKGNTDPENVKYVGRALPPGTTLWGLTDPAQVWNGVQGT